MYACIQLLLLKSSRESSNDWTTWTTIVRDLSRLTTLYRAVGMCISRLSDLATVDVAPLMLYQWRHRYESATEYRVASPISAFLHPLASLLPYGMFISVYVYEVRWVSVEVPLAYLA